MKIFFDVDGVLIDGPLNNPKEYDKWKRGLDQNFGLDDERFVSEFFQKKWNDVVIGKKELLETLEETLPLLECKGTAQDIIDFWMEIDSNVNLQVLETVKKLQDSQRVDLFIATNQDHTRAKYLWNNLGFKNHFKEIFYSGAVGHPKPADSFFQAVNSELNITHDETVLFFDDRQGNVEAGEKNGWTSFLFSEITDLTENDYIREII